MTRIGRYDLGPLLGEGGAGKVYEATRDGPTASRRRVALKILHSTVGPLEREARIGGLLRHRHLVDVFEIGQDDGQWFCAMELCSRGPLSRYIPLPPRAVVEVGLQVCAALQYANEDLGLVHLDIKPQNLLISEHGDIKVADLGIARAEGFAHRANIWGTPGYMAPEQRIGAELDTRADVYALGATLAKLATGLSLRARSTLVSPEGSVDDARTLDSSEFAEADTLPGVPGWLEPVVARCIAPEAADRWADMGALAAALQALDVPGPGSNETLGLDAVAAVAGPQTTHNLPEPADAFVGRSSELANLVEHLLTPGIVTVKGTAGLGKSRLGIEAARHWQRASAAQVSYVDLTTADDEAGLHHAVARALDVPIGRDAAAQLGAVLAGRGTMLLVLDNFEHLVHEGPVVAAWLEGAPELRVLVSSRVALGLAAERVVELDPLDRDAAVELLQRRAQQRGASVVDDPALALLADRLEGLPLAIELAAGRLGVLTAQDILDRIGHGILRSGHSGRHATLQAALEWSWELMSPSERDVLAQLTVFRGGLTVDAAREVLLTSGSAMDVVDALVRHSMVRVSGNGRLDLLVSVRDFAAAKRTPAPSTEVRHGAYYARMGAEAFKPDRERRRTLESSNFIAACTRAVARGDADTAVNTLQGVVSLIELHGLGEIPLELADAVASMSFDGAPQRGLACSLASSSHRVAGNLARAQQLGERAIAHVAPLGATTVWASLQSQLGATHMDQGHLEAAAEHYERALQIARQTGAKEIEAHVLGNRGH
jgi:non-specific serine/threonine protein kinase